MDLYKVLGIDKDATQKQIKSAYRRLSKKHHPDKNGGKGNAKFQEINEAYRILSNPESRRYYDETGFIPNRRKSEEEIIQELAILRLAGLINTLVEKFGKSDQILSKDFIREFLDFIERMEAEINGCLENAPKILKRLELISKKLGDSKIADIFQAQIQKIHNETADMRRELLIAAEARKILEATDYKPEPASDDEEELSPLAKLFAEICERAAGQSRF